MREILAVILMLFVVAFFAGTGAGVYYFVLKPPMTAKKILKNGVETTATITGTGSHFSVGRDNKSSERYFYLNLSFVNPAGESVRYKTDSIYSESFMRKMGIADNYAAANSTIQVISLGDKAVVKDFTPDNSAPAWLWIFPILFPLIGIGLLAATVIGIADVTALSVIKLAGTPGTGVYASHTYDTEIANHYTIYFTFKNAKANTVKNKVVLINRDTEAEMLIALRTFPIKFIGNKAALMLSMDDILQLYEQEELKKLDRD